MTIVKNRPDQRSSPPAFNARQIRSPLAETAYGLKSDMACLLVLEAGRGKLGPEREELTFEAPRMVWLASGRPGTLRLTPGSRGEILEVGDVSLARALPASAFGDELGHVLRRDLSVPLGPERNRVAGWLKELREELSGSEPAAKMMAGHILSLLLIQLWRSAKAGQARANVATGGLARGFAQLAGLHLRDHWQVADYARALGVTRDRLSNAVRRATGRSPQAYLHEALHREAVELLTNSGLQVAQVGFRLGFADPAYFNRFFKRIEGVPPSRYRRRGVRRSEPATSFSEWP